ncbi:hypothetical protein EYC80_004723 [Monilinia laxa]|uniref:Uncharacterized protein n=1 Tax=Monilinia laxa TaxID=61186 RepID=A0A5N6KI48_MONLA|nr:hypothetical protein EYC80_004723 [Monilinia laxa]
MGSISGFEIKDEPVENLRPLKVRIVGAGFSGIYLGIRIPQKMRNVDLQIYDKNGGIGGTWYENRYPGCACDVPSHSYQYSFDPNPDWSSLYAPAAEICAYLQRIAKKYGVTRYIKLTHNVKSCKWDEVLKKWKLEIENKSTGETFEEDADVLISARGSLNEISWPDIPGLSDFQGEVMHSAKWNQNYEFKNKRVGVIGGGSSSIQIVPILQKLEGIRISCFVRSKTWISNPLGDGAMLSMGFDPNEPEFSIEQRKAFANNPETLHSFRKSIEVASNSIHGLSLRDSELQKGAVLALHDKMKERLAKKPEILESLAPSFAVGCRRLTPGPGYLEALTAPNVDFISEKIKSITPNSIKLENGEETPLDVIVCATGFNTNNIPPFPVIGRHGRSLEERFTPYPETYLSITVDDFPNYFMILGPNSNIGSGSLTRILENYASMVPKKQRVKDFSKYCEAYFEKTIYLDKCKSWYKDPNTGRVTGLWPGSTLHALEALRSPRWEDFEYEERDRGAGYRNALSWLGNGWSVTQLGAGDPAWYLEKQFVDVPVEDRPEDNIEVNLRPWSY